MRKFVVLFSLAVFGLGLAAPMTTFAAEQVTPVAHTDQVVYAIPEGVKNITAINFDRGVFSPDVYLSNRLMNAITWAGGGAVAVLVAAIPGIGIQMATVVVQAVKEYTGTVTDGIVIHITNGLVEYVEAQ
ncbi:hypothetical protein BAU15_12005 [Enterococcus sp. JM4C]|uniref:hypothetical protein n=1 Tax=Candidatus Enterococcus huntleyi TaxID=1857217 RepID=UPI00137B429C|nr:hypothetical protein [Enterococcus sp. JM4C]KAF1298472.1 hypothetical protein BAU15_12005 [Enterococcus sp. JM4C]